VVTRLALGKQQDHGAPLTVADGVELGVQPALGAADAAGVVAPERSGRSGCHDGTDELLRGPVSQGAVRVDLVVVVNQAGKDLRTVCASGQAPTRT